MTEKQITKACRGPWASWGDAEVACLATAIVEVSRELARQLPAPRGAPYFGLDHSDGELSSLDQFSSRGIFRKYETVLHLDAGFGAPARWWSARFGCRVVGVAPKTALVLAAQSLSARAGAAAGTVYFCADLGAICCRERYFTHVWSTGRVSCVVASNACLREAFRSLRPGGHAAFQLVDPVPGEVESAVAALMDAGFVEIDVQMVRRPPLNETTRMARDRLLRHLDAWNDSTAGSVGAALVGLYRSRAADEQIAHISARRPGS